MRSEFGLFKIWGYSLPVATLPILRAEKPVQEILCHIHVHSGYSDGALYHADIAAAAARAGVDVLVVTDHNVYVQPVDGWREVLGRRVLLLAGEEIHLQDRIPQKNHLLALGVNAEIAPFAADPQTLIDAVRERGGVSYLAHPFDLAVPLVGEPDLSWVDWDVHGFTGLEVWNYMSEFKSRLRNPAELVGSVFFPSLAIHGPNPQALARWDSFLAQGVRMTAIGGSDAHGGMYAAGPFRRIVFPYANLFRTINMHLMIADEWVGNAEADARMVIESLQVGRGWVGYDRSRATKGFRFWAEDAKGCVEMGGQISLMRNPVLRAHLPDRAHLRLIRAGQGVVWSGNSTSVEYAIRESGAYRLEAWRWFRGRLRGWIFSNPIYAP
jgi:hypothetical protein